MIKFKLNVVNKYEYEENDNYKEIIIVLPKDESELKKDFDYLGLDYENLSIQDAHIKKIEVIDSENPDFTYELTEVLQNISVEFGQEGYTIPFNHIKQLHNIAEDLNNTAIKKLLAVIEVEHRNGNIKNTYDLLNYAKKLDNYAFDDEILNTEDYARMLFDTGQIEIGDVIEYIDIEDVIDYIDLNSIGEAYSSSNNTNITKYGLLERFNDNTKITEEELDNEEMEEF